MKAGVSLLDFKLGLRMIFKYPGLTLVCILALTVAIGLTAAWFEFTKDMLNPTLPLEDGDRVVVIRNWDVATAASEPRSLHDFATWRADLKSVEDLGAASIVEQTLTTREGGSVSVHSAQITASGLQVARVSPLLGRPLLEEDERPDAPPVVVIGYDLWQRLFDADRGVIGRTVQLGSSTSTVVGVMPPGFGFPLNQEAWVPLQANPLHYERGEGPGIIVFGRLAPGVTVHEAQAELTAVGQRTAAAFPETNERLRPRVDRYVDAFTGGGALVRSALNVPFLLLLIVICANVATLFFARTVTREGEIVTRSALGASRARLVLQLFAEALVLTGIAAAIGLAAAGWGIAWGMNLFWEVQGSRPPFWVDGQLSLSTIVYAMALAVLSAALVGVIPALKATGRNLRPGLTHAAAGGSGLRFGAISTGVIVFQVALCVILLPIAFTRGYDALGDRIESIGFPAGEYLSGRLVREHDVALSEMSNAARTDFVARSAQLENEVRRRLASEPGVTGVAFANRLPGMNHPYNLIAIDEGAAATDSAAMTWARALSVDLAFFEVMEAPIVSGRGFQPSDLESGAAVAIVDETFVRENLAGRNPVGHRLSYPGRAEDEGERWFEIVGVVRDLAMNAYGPGGYQDLLQMRPAGYVGVYHPLRAGEASSVQIFLRTNAVDPDELVPGIVSSITSLDPTLAVEGLMPLDDVWRPVHRSERFITWIMAFVVAIVVGLSAAGIYALVSFTVSQRTREIGIRAALGADPRRIIFTIFSRALTQIGLGVLAGALVFGLVVGVGTAGSVWLILAVAGLMFGVGLLACVLPATRALRIEPTEALRGDA